MYTAHTIESPSTELPVDLVEAKKHLRTDDLSHEDSVIAAMVMAAARDIERQYGMAMLTQTVKEYWSAFPCAESEPMLLRIQPVQGVASVEYLDENGLTQTWDAEEWAWGGYNGATFIVPTPDSAWPATWKTPNAVTVTYVAGWGDGPESVPYNIAQALKLQVAASFERREDTPQAIARASENLLRPYFRWAV